MRREALAHQGLEFKRTGSADAHGIAGNRFFPGTITFDDPAVADEFFVAPGSVKQPLSNGSNLNVLDTAVPWSFARLLTPDIAFQVSSGWMHNSAPGFPTQAGFDQTSVEIKGLLYKNDLHETLISGSLGWGIGGSGSQRVGADAPDTIQPGIFFGRGFGDLPDNLSWLRPFAVTGAVSADLPTPRQRCQLRPELGDQSNWSDARPRGQHVVLGLRR